MLITVLFEYIIRMLLYSNTQYSITFVIVFVITNTLPESVPADHPAFKQHAYPQAYKRNNAVYMNAREISIQTLCAVATLWTPYSQQIRTEYTRKVYTLCDSSAKVVNARTTKCISIFRILSIQRPMNLKYLSYYSSMGIFTN